MRRRTNSSGWPSCSARNTSDPMAERIVVGMSGGVDSSVAAALLVAQGCDVVGVTMRVWPWQEAAEPTRRFGSCCGTEAVEDARQVARALGIPYYLLNLEAEFNQKVIGGFVAEYGSGRTPVPCVSCNSNLKFGSLLGRARAWDAVAVATGHYARVERDRATGRYLLLRAKDLRKDQTDFLWPLTQEQLGAARFPVGAPPRCFDPARSSTGAGPRSEVTADSRASPSARSAGSASRRVGRSTSSISTRRATQLAWAGRRTSSAADSWRPR